MAWRFQSLGRVGGGSDLPELALLRSLFEVSIPRTGWGWFGQSVAVCYRRHNRSFNPSDGLGVVRTLPACGSGLQFLCFNPSDGLGVVRTDKVVLIGTGDWEFQSLGRVGGGSDSTEGRALRRYMFVSIPRTGWGWFGRPSNCAPVSITAGFNPSDGLGVVRTYLNVSYRV